MNTLVEVTDLGFQYAKEAVFSNVGFSIQAGDFVALTGPNGAGKSTLLKLLLGELPLQKGTVTLFGQDIGRFRQWPKMGYMPQNGVAVGANFPASVFEVVQANLFSQIGLMRMPNKTHRQMVINALAQVGMQAYAKRPFSKLSGGQQQRVLLARVLVNDPALLIMDEPTTGIDATGVKDLLNQLAFLNQVQKATILMVTHDVARAAAYATRTLCLEEGTLVELSKGQIKHELEHKHHHDLPAKIG